MQTNEHTHSSDDLRADTFIMPAATKARLEAFAARLGIGKRRLLSEALDSFLCRYDHAANERTETEGEE
jgi:hypothetical protein